LWMNSRSPAKYIAEALRRPASMMCVPWSSASWQFPSMPLSTDRPTPAHPSRARQGKEESDAVLAEETVRKRLAARRLIEQLRSICPHQRQASARAHLPVALYRVIHARPRRLLLALATAPRPARRRRFSAKALGRFTMLPKKAATPSPTSPSPTDS
jgi:hypothetical protein